MPSVAHACAMLPAHPGLTGLLLIVASLMAVPGRSDAARGIFSVRDFGAAGDGATDDTDAIGRAIASCAAAGGGQVLFPPGRYLSGTVQLKSHVTVKLDAGATLAGTPDLDRYTAFTPPKVAPEAHFDPHWHRALVLGVGVEDVAIVGPGTVDGNRVFDAHGEERMRGPHTLLFGLSHRITLRDLTIRDSANYAVMLEGCDRVDIQRIRVTGGWDGIHFRGWKGRPCRYVSITDSQFFTGDDSIAGRYWEDTLIADCVINSSCNGIRLIGPAERLTIHGCLFYGPGLYEHRTSRRTNMLSGINLQPGGWDATEGPLDDVLISDVTMKNVSSALHVSLKPGNTAGRITISRLSAIGVYRAACSFESWAQARIAEVVMRDSSIEYTGGGTREQAEAVVKAPGVDARPLPAWAVYARHVGRIALENVRLTLGQPDFRPAIVANEVDRIALDGVRLPDPERGVHPFRWDDVGQVTERDILPKPRRRSPG